jgi:hypothetical protein
MGLILLGRNILSFITRRLYLTFIIDTFVCYVLLGEKVEMSVLHRNIFLVVIRHLIIKEILLHVYIKDFQIMHHHGLLIISRSYLNKLTYRSIQTMTDGKRDVIHRYNILCIVILYISSKRFTNFSWCSISLWTWRSKWKSCSIN